MKKMNDATLWIYFSMINATWKLFRTFRDVHTDEDWIRFSTAAKMIYHKYPYRFMLDLIWVVQDELERRSKHEKREKAG